MVEETVSDEENERRFDAVMAHIASLPIPRLVEWWEIESCWVSARIPNWSRRGSMYEAHRYASHEEALQTVKSWMVVEDYNQFRIVHVVLERYDNKRISTETWTEILKEDSK